MAAAAESLIKYESAVVGGAKTDDILNSILPPLEWQEKGERWVQYVSSTPATRLDVLNLQESLDRKLRELQARETGLCPVREELYAQCFDELIRQTTISCAERGLLLLRVRDEIKLTISAFKTLYESSVAFGMRKALMAQHKRAELTSRIEKLKSENKELSQRSAELKTKCDSLKAKERATVDADATKHADEVAKYKKINDSLKQNLEHILSTPQR
ncbi:hypothetical protein CTAYLR_004555 [Chrysophaeum taylorii]|uniref:33 kDa inner dynein arm light chain, axonemal n=1 Tax=Chrysophaeum taylorii TaxID=2483200 RepID=A0AAD7UGL0_9STRA|nr:hypothetical protein CTAYLR_004555 [Chrysophaeum taylorii]